MHVELNRRFRELVKNPAASESDQTALVASSNRLDWNGLLELPRVVILSEAGAGKTQEIREATQRLRNDGKPAFFLRLENIATSFDTAFELGDLVEFERWIVSSQPGWMLLDSIDEARLQSPKDFDNALRTLGVRLRTALQRSHVVITGRSAAWRPFSDPELCAKRLPFTPPASRAGQAVAETTSVKTGADRTSTNDVFKLFALEELGKDQVRLYAQARETVDIDQLFDELDRSAGWAFTTRPLDLEELLDYWQRNRRIASRQEFLEESIRRRLQESDQDRAVITRLTLERAREGARRIAAACTLTRQQTIAVPDGVKHERGLRLDIVLADWPPEEQAALLQRPIFDEEIYGTVRFHHRVVREYLTAEWMAELLERDGSRAAIEALVFRQRYGLEVINPTTRPVLSWLALRDTRIQQRALRVAPNALFEDGDPSRLPLDTRRSVLTTLCAGFAAGAPRMYSDYTAIQRFAGPDLTNDILALLRQYPDEDIQDFLLRMVWQGRLTGALDDVLRVATSSDAGTSTRIYAIRALVAIGTEEHQAAVRDAVARASAEQDRQLVAELLEHAPATTATMHWLVHCAQNIPMVPRYGVDSLRGKAKEFADRMDLDTSVQAIECIRPLLNQEPFIRPSEFDVSRQHVWLLGPAGRAIRNLINARHPGAMETTCLEILARLPRAQHYDVPGGGTDTQKLGELVAGWQDLVFALFWHLVARARAHPGQRQGPIVNFWQAHLWDTYVKFQPAHFDHALDEVTLRPSLDDKLIALSLAWDLYAGGGRDQAQADRLRRTCEDQPSEVGQRLEFYLNPPAEDPVMRRMRRQNAARAVRAKREDARRVKNLDSSRVFLQENLEMIRGVDQRDHVPVNAQVWLFQHLRLSAKESMVWGAGDWQALAPTMGRDIAEAYRDGIQGYWRRNRPQLVSEGAATNSMETADILGLGGLTVESERNPDWCRQLTPYEVDVAFRYAVRELNGFPVWFSALFHCHPDAIRPLVLREVDHELSLSRTGSEPHYILSDIVHGGHWLWDALGGELLRRLLEANEMSDTTLRYVLNIVQGSDVSDESIRQLACAKCTSSQFQAQARAGLWYAVWTGVAPDEAIPALTRFLASRDSDEDRTAVVMHYLVALTGGRYEPTSRVRKAHVTTEHLKTLYLLAHEHVRQAEDIDRAGTGVYSPGIRDNAQDARENLLSALRAQTGKETFLALSDIARNHPHLAYRPYFEQYARQLAEADSADEAWTEPQVREFQVSQESTPADHRSLFELAVRRLEDLRHTLEEGDTSNAPMLARVGTEKDIRVYIGDWLRERAGGRYHAPQEEEFADSKRADIRLLGQGFDGPVPIELKLANNWSGPQMFERLQNQLCGDYLRDNRSGCGIFLLVYRGRPPAGWQVPGSQQPVDFPGLIQALQRHWMDIAPSVPNVQDIAVIGIDLTKRTA